MSDTQRTEQAQSVESVFEYLVSDDGCANAVAEFGKAEFIRILRDLNDLANDLRSAPTG